MTQARMPVLIGAGQKTYRKASAPGPRVMMTDAVALAAADAGVSLESLKGADFVGVVGFTIDAGGPSGRLPIPRLSDPPATLIADLGARPKRSVYTYMGGNTPQALVNHVCEEIAEGRCELAVLAGAEFLGTLLKRFKAGQDLSSFGEGVEGTPERWGDPRPGNSDQEAAHGLEYPANVYPLFENAVRAARGRGLDEHAAALGRLFAPFSAVAAQTPEAWFPRARSAEEIAAETDDNRMVGFPYTKYMNAIIQVDQSAALILASSAQADALGVAADKRVYLHGCSDVNERWNVLDRVDYARSPAIALAGREALAMAGRTVEEMSFFDLYSCFPVAVELACQELGLAEDDPRGLTVTGGLPYFGGAGNNYSMHAIAMMTARLRASPGAFGLVTANGWHLTKQAFGVYSTVPPEGPWRRRSPADYQREIDGLAAPEIIAEPSGRATIETYTVVHGRERPRMGIVIGRDANGRRFVANTPDDEATLADLRAREGVGRPGAVVSAEGGMRNLFTPD